MRKRGHLLNAFGQSIRRANGNVIESGTQRTIYKKNVISLMSATRLDAVDRKLLLEEATSQQLVA